MVFCLLPKKSGETYTAVFNLIKDKMESVGMSIEIQTFRSGLERGAYRSMRSLFHELGIACCFSTLDRLTCTKFPNMDFEQSMLRTLTSAGTFK